jgi:hypothetical protein
MKSKSFLSRAQERLLTGVLYKLIFCFGELILAFVEGLHSGSTTVQEDRTVRDCSENRFFFSAMCNKDA